MLKSPNFLIIQFKRILYRIFIFYFLITKGDTVLLSLSAIQAHNASNWEKKPAYSVVHYLNRFNQKIEFSPQKIDYLNWFFSFD